MGIVIRLPILGRILIGCIVNPVLLWSLGELGRGRWRLLRRGRHVKNIRLRLEFVVGMGSCVDRLDRAVRRLNLIRT